MKGNVYTSPGTMKGNVYTSPGTMKGNVYTSPGTMKGNVYTSPGTMKGRPNLISVFTTFSILELSPIFILAGSRWLNELGSWITLQLIQAYHQYDVGSHPAL
jgi:hypothetical protein